jgi:transketolase
MSAREPPTPPITAYREGLLTAAERVPTLSVMETGLPPSVASSSFAARFPSRYVASSDAEVVSVATERCAAGGPVFLGAPVPWVLEGAYPSLVRSLVLPFRNVKLVGFPAEGFPPGGRTPPPVRDDLGTMRALPGLTVVAPADGPTVRSATLALADRAGPAYVRLPRSDAPAVTDGTFSVGRAQELRSGGDLTIVALGPMLARALEVADELARAGISVRVLDVASVKPLDEAAILRAARDTGAILVVEASPAGTGLGSLVASMTAENHPVPVRRLGFPDLWAEDDSAARLDELDLSLDRIRDEAWELLRLRGRIA